MLHASDQLYPTRVLRMHLEDTLDTLLREQILERERAEEYNVDSESETEEDEPNASEAPK